MSEHLTIEEAKRRVEKMRQDITAGRTSSAQLEQLHMDEDDLYIAALTAIAAGVEDPAALAATVLEAGELDYIRYYV